MLIRAEDHGTIKKYKKIWFTCETCGIGVLQLYKTYLNQKDKKLCRSCRNKYSFNQPHVKEKQRNRLLKQWQDPNYREKMSVSLSSGCKKAWDKDDGTRRKMVSKNTSDGLKKKWQNDREEMIEKNIKSHEKIREKSSKITTELWKDPNYRKNNITSRKGLPAHNKHSYSYIKKQFELKNCELLSTEYQNAHEKLLVKCPNKHQFSIRYGDFREGHGCPICSKSKQFSIPEKEIADYIKRLGFDILENDRNLIKPLELDINIPSKKIAIEYCGLWWHSENIGMNIKYHLNKLELCEQKGYRLITLFEDEWLNKQKIVKTRLKHILNNNIDKLYARKCIIKEIDTKTAQIFINKYHIRGYKSSSIKLGAFYDTKLVAIMVFTKNVNIWELTRFCLSKPIVGIAGKFLKHFQRNYEWNEIHTFSDRRWDSGDLYNKIGFTKNHIVPPTYWYFNNNKIRFHKFGFRKKFLSNKLENFDPDLSEWENMKVNGWNRIWDCGNIKYILKK